jgi:multidrug transporter EmrE-like cation transporter
MSGYAYLAATVALTVYGQLVTKWRVDAAAALPTGHRARLAFLARLLLDRWIFSGMIAAALAGLTWFAALSALDLSTAYPFLVASFVLVLPLSTLLFGEPMTRHKVVGLILICGGLLVANTG